MKESLKKRISENRLFFLILFFSLLGLSTKLLFLWHSSTAFTFDQARDLLDLREMMVLKKPRLIGAQTSLHGVFYGPFWYWLCFPFYFLTGGHPASNLIPILLISFVMPILFFLLVKDKRLGFLLATIYIFSHAFFSHSIVALNTNPMIFLTPIFLIFLVKFCREEKRIFLWLTMILMGISFHFEPIIGLFWIPIFLTTSFLFRKFSLILKNKEAAIFFLLPFLPQVIFEFRHDFLQTRSFLSLITGKGSSLTPGGGDLISRFFDRLRIFEDVFVYQNGGSLIFSLFLAMILILWLISWRKRLKRPQKEEDFLGSICLISLALVFIGFVFYSYALWPWYLGTVDALMATLIGLGLYFLFVWKRRLSFLAIGLLAIFLFFNVSRYLPWSLEQSFSPDPANLRTRLKVVDLIYDDADDKGFKIFTFAPYVYDYPYQYLIWWRAKTKYHYLPEEYYYLLDQPPYVPAKEVADQLIPSKKSECDYLIIEPFESQEKWFWDWRYRFPEAKETWEIGRTRVEKLCL